MANTEPDAGGTQNFFRSLFQRNTQINAMAGSEIKIAGLEDATQQMAALNNELKGLVTSLTGLSQQQAQLTSGISQTMKTIASNAQQTAGAVEGVTGSMGRFRSGAMSIASIFGSAVNSNFVKDLAMFPLRYITGATEQARNLSMGVSTTLGGQMYATGQSQGELMTMLSNFPGGVRGGVEDVIGLQALMRQYGAMPDLNIAFGRGPGGTTGQPNPRAAGFLEGVREMQAMTPGMPVAQLAQTLGGYASNVSAQQQSAYLTGGAFAMIGAGGHQKSVSEWAEGILRWLEGQRPGDNRGKGFTYGELLAQQFPGSNIDAWLSQQGVPEGMKEYWWNYALAKSRMTGSTTENILPETGALASRTAFKVAPANMGAGQGGNQAWGRLEAATAQSRGQFRLGGALTGMFSNKETANQWFNEMISQVMSEVIPNQIARGSLQAMGVMPDPIQEMMMTFLERSGTIGAALGGYLGYGTQGLSGLNAGVFRTLFAGGLPPNALGTDEEMNLLLGGFEGNPNAMGASDLGSAFDMLRRLFSGDVGDIGDAWTTQGTTSTAGLHPSVKSGIERMMEDNPRIRVSSGLRDTVQQRRLRAAGNSNVSGKPSAHTRGLAADLGPRSEYGWITANAHRYGLKSGKGHGEPWHVGLPGIGDDDVSAKALLGGIGDAEGYRIALDSGKITLTNAPNYNIDDLIPGGTTLTDAEKATLRVVLLDFARRQPGYSGPGAIPPEGVPVPPSPTTPATPPAATTPAATGSSGFGSIFELFQTGITKQGAIEGIGSLVPTLLNFFLGTFGAAGPGGAALDSIAYDPGLYAALRKAAEGPEGIITYGGTYQVTPLVLPDILDKLGSDEKLGPDGNPKPDGGPAPPGAVTPRAIYDYLRQQGVSEASAAGILANIKHESNFDPTNATGDGGTSGGLFQHHAGRWAALKDYADKTDRAWTDWHAQVDFALFGTGEAKDRGFNFNYSDPAAAARWWTLKFEIPANAQQRANERAADAAQYMYGDLGDVGEAGGYDVGGLFGLNTIFNESRSPSATRLPRTARVPRQQAPPDVPRLGDFDYQAAPALSTPSSRQVVFNNTFNINGGGGQGGGIDVRRTVAMLAEQLEGEMKKRLARTN